MALVRVCDRCGNDDQAEMLTLAIGTLELGSEVSLRGTMSMYYKKVDLCGDCVKQLTQFLDGELCIDREDNPVKPGKKEQDETKICSACDKPDINCDCVGF